MTPEHKHIAGLELARTELPKTVAMNYLLALDELIAHAKAAPEPVQGEAVGRFCGEFGGDVNGNMWFKVKTRGSIPAPGAMLYTAAAKPDDELTAMRARFDQIEREIMANKHTAASVFTQMRTAALATLRK